LCSQTPLVGFVGSPGGEGECGDELEQSAQRLCGAAVVHIGR